MFSDYDEQLKLQRNIAMVVLRGLGYGKKSVENRITEEAGFLIEAIKVGWGGVGWGGVGWGGLDWAGLGWAGLGWAGLGWAGHPHLSQN